MHSLFHVSHLYVFPSSLRLTWLANLALETLVYPNQMQYTPCVLQEASLLDGVDAGVHGNSRRFSKTSSYPPCHYYAFTLFYPYFLTMSLFPLFSLIHLLPRPTSPPLYLINHSHTLYCLCPSIISLILLDSETSCHHCSRLTQLLLDSFFYFTKSNSSQPFVDLISLLILSIHVTFILSYPSLHIH